MRPSVTALIPIRNGAEWIKPFINYLTLELREDDEALFIDDNSIDDSYSLVQKLISGIPNARILQNSGDGLVDALNLGLTEARRQWIARFDIDDVYSLGRLDCQLSLLHSDTGLVFGDYSFFGNGKTFLGVIPSAIWDFPTKLSLLSSQRTPHPLALFKKSIALEAGMYEREDYPAEDLGLWLRIARHSKLVTIPIVLLKYNLRQNSISSSRYYEIKNLTKQILNKYPLTFPEETLSLGSINSIVKNYSEFTYGDERKILFILDVLRYSIKSKGLLPTMRKYLIFCIWFFLVPKRIFALTKLIIQRRQRQQFRQSKPELHA